MKDLRAVLKLYNIHEDAIILSFGSGLINKTYQVKDSPTNKEYILQHINKSIFKSPRDIEFNVQIISNFLSEKYPLYHISLPLPTIDGEHMAFWNEEYYRLFDFIKGSHTIDIVTDANQAYEAAKQFADFTSTLIGIKTTRFKFPLPDFHNLELRFQQYNDSLINGNPERIRKAKPIIDSLKRHIYIVNEYQKIKRHPDFKLRIMHHDTKISNVLFNANEKGIGVIDLDTVMPGYFISDVGDMMRTYLSPVDENEKDLSKIHIREDVYQAIVDGYNEKMGNELTKDENKYFIYGGKFMIYMQAIRFLADHFNNDIYYGAKYENHNLTRAENQITLLQRLTEFEKTLP